MINGVSIRTCSAVVVLQANKIYDVRKLKTALLVTCLKNNEIDEINSASNI